MTYKFRASGLRSPIHGMQEQRPTKTPTPGLVVPSYSVRQPFTVMEWSSTSCLERSCITCTRPPHVDGPAVMYTVWNASSAHELTGLYPFITIYIHNHIISTPPRWVHITTDITTFNNNTIVLYHLYMLPWQPTKRTNPNTTMSSSKDHTHTQTFMYNYNNTTPYTKTTVNK